MKYSARAWSAEPSYGDVFYARATGDAPEMESSKAAAKQLKNILKPNASILDVGCGAGHYLRSLRKEFDFPFTYQGVDITPHYIRLAKKAYKDDPNASFRTASIGKLPFEDQSFDIVMCCNVLLHLPGVVGPIRELWRVTEGMLIVRTQIGSKNFRIQQVPEPEKMAGKRDPVFKTDGEPRQRHFYNIYSENYMKWLCSTLPDMKSVSIKRDEDFDPNALGSAQWPEKRKPTDLTEVWNGWQLHHYILQPWSFMKVRRKKVKR